MGEVYRARDTMLEREVALKVLPEAFAADPDRLVRFQREAKVLASLNHPHIAAIYGLADSRKTHALILELVEGPTLADRIAKGPIPLEEALPIAKQIAEALEAAHEQGIIHRDLKPANIKVRDDGTVKVLDFGLAKAMEPASAISPMLTNSPTITTPAMVTGIGTLLGTAAYMSPEQAKGRPADKRSDVWAFGYVLFEMLTGKRAFEGDDVSDTLANVLKSEPDWNALPESVPAQVRAIIRNCLQKDRRQRIGDIGTALFVIRYAADTELPHQPRAPKLWRRGTPAVAAAVVASVLTGLAARAVMHRPVVLPGVIRFAIPFEEQNFEGAFNQVAAISPDASQIVYFAGNELYRRSLSDATARPIPGIESGSFGFRNYPVFSPDGHAIAFWTADNPASGEIRRVSAEGGAPVALAKAFRPTGISWSGDTILVGEMGIGIVRVPANGGAPDVVVRINRDESAADPQLLPGGDKVLFTLASGFSLDGALPVDSWDKAKIVVQSLKTGTRRTVVDGGSAARYLPTGHLVYAVGTTLLAVPFDVNQQKTVGAPTSVVEHVRRGVVAGLSNGAALFSLSESGSLIYVPASSTMSVDERALAVFDRRGGIQILKLPPARYEAPRISPDGTRLAYDIDDGKEASVWVADLSGARSPLRITFAGQNRLPIWSPDGKRLAFQSDRGGDRGIYSQRADGSGVAERLTKADADTAHEPNSWSSKGDVLLYSVRTQGRGVLWTLSMSDKRTAMFGDGKQTMFAPTPAFSRDGRWVAYTAIANGLSVVFVQPYPATGAKYQISKEPDSHHPVWSPNGNELIYLNGAVQLTSVSVTSQPSFAFGNPVRLTSTSEGALTDLPFNPRNYDVAPNGQQFIRVVDADAAKRSGPPPNPTLNVVLNWFEELKQRVPSK